jgi:hypothetical protein
MQAAKHENVDRYHGQTKGIIQCRLQDIRDQHRVAAFLVASAPTPKNVTRTHLTRINLLENQARMANCRYKTPSRHLLLQKRLSVTTVHPEGANSFQELGQFLVSKYLYHDLAMFSGNR